MKILYLGNKLEKKGFNPTSIEVLGEKLKLLAEVIQVSEFRSPLLRFFDMAWAIVSNKSKVNLVLIDTYSTSGFYIAYTSAKICRMMNLPYVPILHGGGLPDRIVSSRKLCNEFFNKAAFLVAPSAYMMDNFQKEGYQNIKLIPNQIDVSEIKYTKRPSAQPKLLWVRSFNEIYNPRLAVEVVKGLKKKYPDVKLSMVGPDADGSLAKVQSLIEEYELQDQIALVGKMTREEWFKIAEDHDVFLNTTNVDNTPVSVMEAMAMGMCVVTTNVGGIPFLIDNEINGLLVDPENAEVLIEKISWLLDNPEKADQISINARSKAQDWDWEEVKKLWEINLEEFK